MALLECVPNFSEGRNPESIRLIAAAVERTPGVYLLDVDPGQGANRTVMTFAGAPESVLEAAFQAIRVAASVIDMRTQTGTHPRIGATDVCPLIPIEGLTMEETAELGRRLGKRVGEELAIPVFLYEESASALNRRNLATIRSGEYEGLPEKLKDPLWQPDFGPVSFHARAGATVIGARDFLVAYNVNLNTTSVHLAQQIAAVVREKGRLLRHLDTGQPLRDEGGNLQRIPGACPGVKAIGWYIPEYGRAQVSMNLTNLSRTTVHTAFEACRKAAAVLGVEVTGSELIGMIPRRALLEAGVYFSEKKNEVCISEEELMSTAVRALGLDELAPFDLRKKVLEYRLADLGWKP